MNDKEMARLTAVGDDRKKTESEIMAKMNQPTNVNLNEEAMREMDEHLREKEKARLTAEEEGLSPKRR